MPMSFSQVIHAFAMAKQARQIGAFSTTRSMLGYIIQNNIPLCTLNDKLSQLHRNEIACNYTPHVYEFVGAHLYPLLSFNHVEIFVMICYIVYTS